MIKRIAIFFLLNVLLISMAAKPSFSYNAEEHDAYLEKVLFGIMSSEYMKTDETKKKIQMLEYASYLSLDQMRGQGANELDFLKKQKVKKLPKLEDFDLTGIYYGNHRNYTHRGWDYVYSIPKGEKHDKANWPIRKKILTSTVNKIFDFGFKNELFGKVSEKCNSFSALVYYVHILGDHIAKDSYKINDLTMPLAREHASENNLDLFWEIKVHSQKLFSDQKNSINYSSFIQELDVLAIEARTLVGTKGGINESNFPEYHGYAVKLMDTLKTHIPHLLKNEDFFKTQFYPS